MNKTTLTNKQAWMLMCLAEPCPYYRFYRIYEDGEIEWLTEPIYLN